MSITITIPTINYHKMITKVKRHSKSIGVIAGIAGVAYLAYTKTDIPFYMGLADRKFLSVTEVNEKIQKIEEDKNQQIKQVEEKSFRADELVVQQQVDLERREEEIRATRVQLEELNAQFDLTKEAEAAFKQEQEAAIAEYQKQISEWEQASIEIQNEHEDAMAKLRGGERVSLGVNTCPVEIEIELKRQEAATKVEELLEREVDMAAEHAKEIRELVASKIGQPKKQAQQAKKRAAVARDVIPVDVKSNDKGEGSSRSAIPKTKVIDPPGKGDNYYKKKPEPTVRVADILRDADKKHSGFKAPTDIADTTKYQKLGENSWPYFDLYWRLRIRQLGDAKKIHGESGLPFVPITVREQLQAECDFYRSHNILPKAYLEFNVNDVDRSRFDKNMAYARANAAAARRSRATRGGTKAGPTRAAPTADLSREYYHAPYPFQMGHVDYTATFAPIPQAVPGDWTDAVDGDLPEPLSPRGSLLMRPQEVAEYARKQNAIAKVQHTNLIDLGVEEARIDDPHFPTLGHVVNAAFERKKTASAKGKGKAKRTASPALSAKSI